jgi:putative SOS response-associated peptidase YedK
MMARLHNRMPVILTAEDVDAWLSPDTPLEGLEPLFAPVDEGLLKAIAVSRRVNSPANDGPGLIQEDGS